MNFDNIIADVREKLIASISADDSKPDLVTADLILALASKKSNAHNKDMADELTELRTQLAEAKTDKKFSDMLGEVRTGFAEIQGEIGKLNSRIEHIEKTTAGIKTTVVGTGVALAALIIGVLTYGQTWFGIGVSTRDIIRATVTELNQQHPAPPAKP